MCICCFYLIWNFSFWYTILLGLLSILDSFSCCVKMYAQVCCLSYILSTDCYPKILLLSSQDYMLDVECKKHKFQYSSMSYSLSVACFGKLFFCLKSSFLWNFVLTCRYTLFWVLVLSCKFLFSYIFEVSVSGLAYWDSYKFSEIVRICTTFLLETRS